MRYKPKSIKEEGIDNYLNRTKAKHHGFGAVEYRILKLAMKFGLSISTFARIMNVNRQTISKWLEIDTSKTEEHEKAVEDLRNV